MRNCILRFFQTLTSGVIVLGLFAGGNLQAESPKVASQSTPQFIPRPILDSIKSEISENLRESEKKGPVVWVKKLESMKAISVGDVDSRDLLLRAFSKIPRVNMTIMSERSVDIGIAGKRYSLSYQNSQKGFLFQIGEKKIEFDRKLSFKDAWMTLYKLVETNQLHLLESDPSQEALALSMVKWVQNLILPEAKAGIFNSSTLIIAAVVAVLAFVIYKIVDKSRDSDSSSGSFSDSSFESSRARSGSQRSGNKNSNKSDQSERSSTTHREPSSQSASTEQASDRASSHTSDHTSGHQTTEQNTSSSSHGSSSSGSSYTAPAPREYSGDFE